jgi:hypothetical protein
MKARLLRGAAVAKRRRTRALVSRVREAHEGAAGRGRRRDLGECRRREFVPAGDTSVMDALRR